MMSFWVSNILFVMLLLCGCSSFERSALRSQWRYTVLKERIGSVHQESVGVLTYKNRVVPGDIQIIVCPVGTFFYRKKDPLRYKWSGWVKDESAVSSFSEVVSDTAITKSDLERGFYFAAYKGKKRDTPQSWIWVRFAARRCWMKPEGLFYYSKFYSAK